MDRVEIIIFFVFVILMPAACFISLAGALILEFVRPEEDLFKYIKRVKGGFDQKLYQQLIGAANPYKEGDETLGVAAGDDMSRANARVLLSNTKIRKIHEHPLFEDRLQKLIWETTDSAGYERIKDMTMGELKGFLLNRPEADIKDVMQGLDSDVIACVVKLMSNAELTTVGQKVFNPLPGSRIGAKGYLGARLQPNSPTDNPEDIMWQVFDGWSYATGDVVLGTNPVSDSIENIAGIQNVLKDVVVTFGLEDVIPWCVLAHVDKQHEVEELYPGSTALWFQSLAGCDYANQTFDISIEKMTAYAKMRKGRFGLYFETGQGADFTNGAGNGFDMVVHESRKYGFARALSKETAKISPGDRGWSIINDVAGFIGPEVFKNREQLVRCCLEDIVMGKLHGLTIGLDVCSTLHMPVSLDDLDWAMDRIMPANPAYLMALPTKNDPMLSYLTTAFQDHVRLRGKFGYKVNEPMWAFFKKIGIIDEKGSFTEHAGDPIWVYYKYRLAKGDNRSKNEIYADGEEALMRIRGRGVPIARGYGKEPWEMDKDLKAKIWDLYNDAKISLWAEFTPEFINTIPDALLIVTMSSDREDYVAHPSTGEKLSAAAVASLEELRESRGKTVPDVQIVISDGLNTNAIMDEGHLAPYINTVSKELAESGYSVAGSLLLVRSGRVRAGYEIGSILFGKAAPEAPKVILHVIGERPGTGHHNYSVYIAAPKSEVWKRKGVDHDIVRVLSGISDSAYSPVEAAKETVVILNEMTGK